LEPVLAARFEAETGIKTSRIGTLRSVEHPHMIANLDRITADGGALEEKTTEWFTPSGTATGGCPTSSVKNVGLGEVGASPHTGSPAIAAAGVTVPDAPVDVRV